MEATARTAETTRTVWRLTNTRALEPSDPDSSMGPPPVRMDS